MQAILLVYLYPLTKSSDKATSNHLLFVHSPVNTCPFEDKNLVLIPMWCDKNSCAYTSHPVLDYIGKRTPLAQCMYLWYCLCMCIKSNVKGRGCSRLDHSVSCFFWGHPQILVPLTSINITLLVVWHINVDRLYKNRSLVVA